MNWLLPDVDTYFNKVLTSEGFEIDHLKEALKFCKKFRLAIDGGAHVGTWSVYLSSRFDQVMSFEPAEDSYKCLVDNLNNNVYIANVLAIRAALGAKKGFCTLVDDPMRAGNTGARLTFFGKGVIPVDTIDRYNLKFLDFLKLDLEGSEVFALQGAFETISRCKPTIMVECKEFTPPRGGGVQATRDYLRYDLGYREVGGIRNDRVFVPL